MFFCIACHLMVHRKRVNFFSPAAPVFKSFYDLAFPGPVRRSEEVTTAIDNTRYMVFELFDEATQVRRWMVYVCCEPREH